jgi:hypothetical protein
MGDSATGGELTLRRKSKENLRRKGGITTSVNLGRDSNHVVAVKGYLGCFPGRSGQLRAWDSCLP